MQPENSPGASEFYRFLTGKAVAEAGQYGIPVGFGVPPAAAVPSLCSSSFCPWDVSEITESPEARVLAASKNHKEAEKRRRERINSHLNSLRTLLPCNSKTDKASLLAKVIERVKELKEQTSELMQLETFPSEADEINILTTHDSPEDGGRLLIKASLCCEDRSDLTSDLIETLKLLRLSPLRSEMVAMGGRIRHVISVTSERDQSEELVHFLRDALRSLVHRSSSDTSDRTKRRRMFDHPRMIG